MRAAVRARVRRRLSLVARQAVLPRDRAVVRIRQPGLQRSVPARDPARQARPRVLRDDRGDARDRRRRWSARRRRGRPDPPPPGPPRGDHGRELAGAGRRPAAAARTQRAADRRGRRRRRVHLAGRQRGRRRLRVSPPCPTTSRVGCRRWRRPCRCRSPGSGRWPPAICSSTRVRRSPCSSPLAGYSRWPSPPAAHRRYAGIRPSDPGQPLPSSDAHFSIFLTSPAALLMHWLYR